MLLCDDSIEAMVREKAKLIVKIFCQFLRRKTFLEKFL